MVGRITNAPGFIDIAINADGERDVRRGHLWRELRIANTATGSSVLVGEFSNDARTETLAFTPPPAQLLRNPGFESGRVYWHAAGSPFLPDTSHSRSWSAHLSGEECWAWQGVFTPTDAMDVSLGYWVTGVNSDPD